MEGNMVMNIEEKIKQLEEEVRETGKRFANEKLSNEERRKILQKLIDKHKQLIAELDNIIDRLKKKEMELIKGQEYLEWVWFWYYDKAAKE